MKIVTIVLAILTVALSCTSVVLLSRVQEERARANTEALGREAWEARAKLLAARNADIEETMDMDAAENVAPAAASRDPASLANRSPSLESDADAVRRQMPGRIARGPLSAFNTPQGREMMRVQARGQDLRMYGDAFRKLQLPPAQVDALLNLLADQRQRELDMVAQHRGNFAARAQARKDLQAQAQAEVAALLGPQNGGKFSNYQVTMRERAEVNQYADQLQALKVPIADDQKEKFIAAMAEERAAIPAPELTSWRDTKAREARIEWQADYNRRVQDRASAFLSPEQHRHIREFNEWQLSLQRQPDRAPGGRQRIRGPAN